MLELIAYFKALYFYTHNAHNLCSGPTFFEDHEFFGELYEFADKGYDDLVERYIGTQNDAIDLVAINKKALDGIAGLGNNYMANTLNMCIEINSELQKMSIIEDGGILNLIQGQQDQLQVFIYKLKRRTK